MVENLVVNGVLTGSKWLSMVINECYVFFLNGSEML
jgi:hypothetical protein